MAQGEQGTAQPLTSCAEPARRPVIGPLSVAFATPSDGWLLGITLPACQGPGGSRLALRTTTDGGRSWSPLPAPATSRGMPGAGGAAGVSQVLFANPRDGWAFGPDLWATHDGGIHWQQIPTHGAQVSSMAATSGRVIAAFTPPGQAQRSVTVYTSPAARNDWHPIPGTASHGSPQLVTSGGTGYALIQNPPSGGTLLAGPADGSSRWQTRPLPCRDWRTIAATRAGLALACAPLGVHPTPTRLYLSVTSGRTWRPLASLILDDGATSVSVSPGGPTLITGGYNGLLISSSPGHTWRSIPAVDHNPTVGGGTTVDAAMTTSRDGYVFADMTQLWFTHNTGHTWIPITLH